MKKFINEEKPLDREPVKGTVSTEKIVEYYDNEHYERLRRFSDLIGLI